MDVIIFLTVLMTVTTSYEAPDLSSILTVIKSIVDGYLQNYYNSEERIAYLTNEYFTFTIL